MSVIFTLSGTESILKAIFNPPIYLNKNEEYVLGFTNFESFNVIPNIHEKNNKFYYDYNNKVINIEPGSYVIEKAINVEIEKSQKQLTGLNDVSVSLKANNCTLKSIIKSNVIFDLVTSAGDLLGFKKKIT